MELLRKRQQIFLSFHRCIVTLASFCGCHVILVQSLCARKTQYLQLFWQLLVYNVLSNGVHFPRAAASYIGIDVRSNSAPSLSMCHLSRFLKGLVTAFTDLICGFLRKMVFHNGLVYFWEKLLLAYFKVVSFFFFGPKLRTPSFLSCCRSFWA